MSFTGIKRTVWGKTIINVVYWNKTHCVGKAIINVVYWNKTHCEGKTIMNVVYWNKTHWGKLS